MLGVALGVVLMPQLAAAKAAKNPEQFSDMMDWGLRLVVLIAIPSAVALLFFAQPLVSVVFHNGRYSDADVAQTAHAVMGYGAGLLGLVAIKVLAPAYFAHHDVRTPAKIAAVVLVITQALNAVFVPFFGHAGLALALGLGSMVNAAWLLWGLLRNKTYIPQAGWWRFTFQVLVASTLLAGFLLWANQAVPWLALKSHRLERVALLTGVVTASVAIYFVAIRILGVPLRQFLRR